MSESGSAKEPISIECPDCGALPGMKCSERLFGVYHHTFHNLRIAASRLPEPPSAPLWDRNRDQEEQCKCGHPYRRHFDPFEDNAPVGCKYCDCFKWEPPSIDQEFETIGDFYAPSAGPSPEQPLPEEEEALSDTALQISVAERLTHSRNKLRDAKEEGVRLSGMLLKSGAALTKEVMLHAVTKYELAEAQKEAVKRGMRLAIAMYESHGHADNDVIHNLSESVGGLGPADQGCAK